MSVRLPPGEAGSAVRLVFQAAGKEVRDAQDFWPLYEALSVTDPVEANHYARLILAELKHEQDTNVRWCLAAGMASLAILVSPDDAVKICAPPHLALRRLFYPVRILTLCSREVFKFCLAELQTKSARSLEFWQKVWRRMK